MQIGSNAAYVWWVNGQQVIGIYGDGRMVIDGVSKPGAQMGRKHRASSGHQRRWSLRISERDFSIRTTN
jgi:hypothetical protein